MSFSTTLAMLLSTGILGSSDIFTERIFGPEIPGKYKHPAAIAELKNGDLLLVYYGGSGEYSDDSTVFGSRLPSGEHQWNTPRAITPRPKEPEGNAVVWQAPDGVVWLFSVTRHGATWCSSQIVARVSTNNGHSWSHPRAIATEPGSMVRCKPIVLKNGDYLLPIYHETGNDPEFTAADTSSLFLRYDPKTQKWSPTNRIHSRLGNLQPAVVLITDNYLVCYCRRGADYGPRKDGYLVRSESRDGGQTWGPGIETAFPNPNSAVDFLKLKNGHLFLVYNDSMSLRTPLTAAISFDNDKTYPVRRNLAEGPKDFAYPFAIQASDGKIHVVYTTDQRTVIMHAVFDESAILKPARPERAKGSRRPIRGGI
jgi:predicted neuraminidase